MKVGSILALAFCVAFLGRQAQAQTAYTVDASGGILIRFDLSNPGVTAPVNISIQGIAGAVDGLDYRASDGKVYLFTGFTNDLGTVDTNTAEFTFVSQASTGSSTRLLGVDFDPVSDRLRLVNLNNQNLLITPANGSTSVGTSFTYAAGDAHFGATPSIIEVAYTNNDTNPATTSKAYYIDDALDTLVTTTDPNSGVLNTVGPLGVDTNSVVGFDIYTHDGTNSAYALLGSGNTSTLYSINLDTGAATSLGAFGGPPAIGLAIVPEPGMLSLLCLAAPVLLRRKRK